MVLARAGDAEHQTRKGRELATLQHVREHALELRDDVNHQHGHNGDGHHQHRDGIEHGGDDLALDLLRLFHELGQTVEHDFEHTAQFAGLHHVDIETIENLGM